MAKICRIPLTLILIFCVDLSLGSVVYDPFQPIWDGMEELPEKILKDMHDVIKSQLATVSADVDQKIENLKVNLWSVVESRVDKSQEEENEKKLQEETRDALTEAIESFYRNTMKPDFENEVGNEHTIVHLEETESKVSRHLDHTLRKTDFLFNFDSTLEDHVAENARHQQSVANVVEAVDTKVSSIREVLKKGKVDVCSTELEYLQEKIPSKERIEQFESEFVKTYEDVVGDLPRIFFGRDCSEILNWRKDSQSGVYTIYPTRDLKKGVSVWCDMETVYGGADATAGWTVMLRRRKTSAGLENFNRSWTEYAEGFGEPGKEGEWWLGLNWVHQLTYSEPHQLLFLLHDIEDGDKKAYYANFRIEDESRDFSLNVDGFTNLGIDDAFAQAHHGQPFSTVDNDHDECPCNCAFNNQGAWWYKICHRTVLTARFPTSNNREEKTIRWLSGKWLVLDDVTMMIKPASPN